MNKCIFICCKILIGKNEPVQIWCWYLNKKISNSDCKNCDEKKIIFLFYLFINKKYA